MREEDRPHAGRGPRSQPLSLAESVEQAPAAGGSCEHAPVCHSGPSPWQRLSQAEQDDHLCTRAMGVNAQV
eukprot:366288-Chlamydomonas_euryale.AAC.4